MLATPDFLGHCGQLARVGKLIPRWREIPLYRDWLMTGFSFASPEQFAAQFARLPFITKRDMRQDFPANFLGRKDALELLLKRNQVELEYTSGTSEERLPVILGRGWWNEQESRALRLNAFVARVLDEHAQPRRATITTPACNGLTCPTVWVSRAQRTFDGALFVNLARIPFVLTEAELDRMAGEIGEWAPQFLDTDPVHATWLALHCERRGLRFPSLRFILGSYEFVSVVHQRIIERVFGVPVFNLYGSTETGHLMMEDDRGEMKPSCETALLEIVQRDAQHIGELIVTTLSNDYMPLVRYRIGDLAQWQPGPNGGQYVVQGRARDALLLAIGRRVTTTWQVDQCFKEVHGIAHYQLRQNSDSDFLLRFIPDGAGPDDAGLRELVQKLEHLLEAPGAVKTESVNTLLPSPSGKFRLTCRAD
jgi:phenylacetate-CoA ligase